MKNKQTAKADQRAKNREVNAYSHSEKAHRNCRMCSKGNEFDRAKVGESEHWIVLYPGLITGQSGSRQPLTPAGSTEAMTHL